MAKAKVAHIFSRLQKLVSIPRNDLRRNPRMEGHKPP